MDAGCSEPAGLSADVLHGVGIRHIYSTERMIWKVKAGNFH